MEKTPLSPLILDGREYIIKRDDLIDPHLAGNKYRKLYTLVQTPKEKYRKIISYGGTQSNAMLAIASLAQKKGWIFEYYTKPLSQTQKEQTIGNYANAIKMGMQHRELESQEYRDVVSSLHFSVDESAILIDQGGADKIALEGLDVLAEEIRDSNAKFDAIATPSGTGTTALFLARALPDIRVYTTPSVGDIEYLKTQMSALWEIPKNLTILEPSKKYHFAKPKEELFTIYKKLLNAGVEFDLLYAPLMFKTLQEKTNEKILYIHSGGVSGNETMLKRYEKLGLKV
jgi:1-aminocyclopropane-1-carboxylate deaminase/D-cysteine desulfhydrase-like pyridoxal-dependent ACC family enzyme